MVSEQLKTNLAGWGNGKEVCDSENRHCPQLSKKKAYTWSKQHIDATLQHILNASRYILLVKLHVQSVVSGGAYLAACGYISSIIVCRVAGVTGLAGVTSLL